MSFELDRSLIKACLSGNIHNIFPINGGDTHRCYRVVMNDQQTVFAKVNRSAFSPVLETEAQSLRSLQAAGADWYPTVLTLEQNADGAVLVLDYRELGSLNSKTAADLGYLLARQHCLSYSHHGWHHDNHIGLTTQSNPWNRSWLEFYRHQRLLPQFLAATENGLDAALSSKVERLLENLDFYLDDSNVKPALLHGDLWTGNTAADVVHQKGFLFDPAPYYGDAEADLAMTRLFGGFMPEFYAAYHERVALKPGSTQRISIYNLYHALNHFNLFGRVYTGLVAQCLEFDT